MMPRSRDVARPTSSRSGRLPSPSEVAPPIGATASPWAAAPARMSATSLGRSGSTILLGVSPSTLSDRRSVIAVEGSECIDAVLLRHGLGAEGPDFAAHVAFWEELLGVEGAARIEGVLESGHRGEVFAGEDEGQVVAFFGADAVLAGEGAADLDAIGQDLLAGAEDPFDVAFAVAVEEHERVEIAVAGVENVGDAEVEVARDLADALQRGGEFGAGNDGVVQVVVR